MKHKQDLAKGWMMKGDSDLATIKLTINSDGPYDTACFHAQQAVEKYLKAILAFHGEPIPRTHDLEEIQLLCIKWIETSEFRDLSLEELSDYAVSVRYDFEFWPDIDTAKDVHLSLRKVFALSPETASMNKMPAMNLFCLPVPFICGHKVKVACGRESTLGYPCSSVVRLDV